MYRFSILPCRPCSTIGLCWKKVVSAALYSSLGEMSIRLYVSKNLTDSNITCNGLEGAYEEPGPEDLDLLPVALAISCSHYNLSFFHLKCFLHWFLWDDTWLPTFAAFINLVMLWCLTLTKESGSGIKQDLYIICRNLSSGLLCCMSEMCRSRTSNYGGGDVFWSLSMPSSLELSE